MFGRAGTAVALYVLQLPDAPPEPRLTLAATAMFADAAAKAEFNLRCQKSDPAAVEAWFSGHCDQCWTGFLTKNPSFLGDDEEKAKLIAKARGLIDRNWQHVMTVASAYAASHIDIDGREYEFLDAVYTEPDA